MLLEEKEYHVASLADIGRIHCHLAKEILHVGLYHGQRAKTIPKVVESEKTFRTVFVGVLIFKRHKATSQLNGPRQIILDEFLREMEHVTRGEDRLSFLVKLNVRAQEIAIATYYFLFLRIPYNKLLVTVLASVELIEIHFLARSSTSLAEYNLTQSTNLLQDIGSIMRINDVNLVVALVCHSQLAFWRQFALQQFFCYWLDNVLFHFLFVFWVALCNKL